MKSSTPENTILIFAPSTAEERDSLSNYIRSFSKPGIIPYRNFLSINYVFQDMGIKLLSEDFTLKDSDITGIFKDHVCLALRELGCDIEFVNEMFSLRQASISIPPKAGLTVAQDQALNVERLKFIKQVLIFLSKYTYFSFKYSLDNHATLQIIDSIVDAKIGLLLAAITVLTEITGDFRLPFKTKLGPVPFTWETFEHLGGVLQHESYESLLIVPQNRSLEQSEAALKCVEESNLRRAIIREAFISIRKDDLPQLLGLVDGMLKKAQDPNYNINLCPSVQLVATRAIVARILNQETLSQLITLCFHHQPTLTNIRTVHDNNGGRYSHTGCSSDNPFITPNLSTKQVKHSFLNRLINIGELCTGKYLSPALQRLADKGFFQILVDIRDAIAHQDEVGNKSKVDNLLQNNVVLLNNVAREMEKLHQYFSDLQFSIYQKTVRYDKNLKKFWADLYAEAKQPQVESETFTKEQEAVKGHLGRHSKDLQRLISEFFEGYTNLSPEDELTIEGLFNNNDKGLQRFKTAITQTRTKFSIFQSPNWKQAFPFLLQLRNVFYDASGASYLPGTSLTKIARAQTAITAIENIAEILLPFGVTSFNGMPDQCEQWFNANKTRLEVVSNLSSENRVVLNALQYNAGLCLQHVDALRNIVGPAAFNGYSLLGPEYELKVRFVRNYMIHGNRLLDPPLSNSKMVGNIQVVKANFIVNCIIFLLIQLKPEIKQFEQILIKQQEVINATSSNSNQQASVASGILVSLDTSHSITTQSSSSLSSSSSSTSNNNSKIPNTSISADTLTTVEYNASKSTLLDVKFQIIEKKLFNSYNSYLVKKKGKITAGEIEISIKGSFKESDLIEYLKDELGLDQNCLTYDEKESYITLTKDAQTKLERNIKIASRYDESLIAL